MAVENSYKCECSRCKRVFDSTKIIETKYQEYAGASFQSSFVSPCCHFDYYEFEDNEVSP